MILVALFSNL